ncbi:MAG: hypothetical protein SO142_07965, partial [Prevotella sp.]|nr:hypothetical protein [Prevotella sp.]
QRDKRKSWVKWQPAFRLVKVVFVVVNRQHRVHNQTVVPVVSVVVKTKNQNHKQKPQAKDPSTSLKWQPAFRLVKVVFVVVNRQHIVQNQTVVPVVCVVVKTKARQLQT